MTATNVRVTIGDDPAWTFTAAQVDAERWNGWACPWFTETEGRKIAAVSKADHDRNPDLSQEYVEVRVDAPSKQRFWMLAPGEDQEPYAVEAQNFDGIWLYAIAAGNWTWEEASCDKAAPVQMR